MTEHYTIHLRDCMNLDKCEFNKDKIVFFGVTKEGISPNPIIIVFVFIILMRFWKTNNYPCACYENPLFSFCFA
jgi:hypothetical protein